MLKRVGLQGDWQHVAGMGIWAKEIERLLHLVWFSGLEGSIPKQYRPDQNNVNLTEKV